MDTRDFHRTKGTKPPRNPRFHKASKEATKIRLTNMVKGRRKATKPTYNGPREAYMPDQVSIDDDDAEELYYRELCYTDKQRYVDYFVYEFLAFGDYDDIPESLSTIVMLIIKKISEKKLDRTWSSFPPWRQ